MMEDWAIVAISAEVAIFVLVIILYIFIYLRYARRVNGRSASATRLYYFYERFNTVHSLALPSPASGGGVAPTTVTAQWLMTAIAHDLRATYKDQAVQDLTADDLVLARFDKASRTCVTLDLNVVLQEDKRGLFVEQTASEPLALLHHQQYNPKYQPAPMESPPPAIVVMPPSSTRRSSVKRAHHAYHSSPYASSVPVVNTDAPVPQFHPTRDLISTKDPITITAAAFTYLDFPEQTVPAEAVRIIQDMIQAGEKAVKKTWDDMMTITFDPHPKTFGVASSGKLILLSFTGRGAEAPRQVVAGGTNNIRYSTTDGEWQPYQGPFRLPRGRWCIQAEATSPDGSRVRSNSHVFSVEDDFSSM